jgi:uncharacterized protein YrrD
MWIFSIETEPALPLGMVVDVVVDSNNGKIQALWAKTLEGLCLVDFRDIKKWGRSEIYISSQKDILKPEEFPRIFPVLEREVPIISAKVFVREGDRLLKIGQVKDFVIETSFPVILSILVNTGWWIFGRKVEIPRSRILEISEKGIIVSDNLLKIKDDEVDSSVLPSID